MFNNKLAFLSSFIPILSLCLALFNCGGSPPARPPLASAPTQATLVVSVSPSQSLVYAGSSLQLVAIPSGATPTNLTWLVNGSAGGGGQAGTISSAGLYIAPQFVTADTVVSISVTSTTDRIDANTATITLMPKTVPIAVSVSPNATSLNPGQTQQFKATVTGTANTGVNWLVDGTKGGNTISGTISANGLYTAPQTVIVASSVTIAAVSAYDGTSLSAATVALHPGSSPTKSPPTLVNPIGINMSEAEYSWGSFPGAADLAYISSNRITLIRLPIAWERAQPILGGPLDPTYLSAMKAFIGAAGAQNMKVIVDVHDYGRYNTEWAYDMATKGVAAPGSGTDPNDIIGSPTVPISVFADFWKQLASSIHDTPGLAYYDLMNEPYDMGGADVWSSAAQAAVNGIRSVDMNTTILVEGTQWASAYWWPRDNANLHITDPASNLLYEAHLYFDSDGSGRYTQSYAASGAYPTIGADRLQPFLTWLRDNDARGFLGEFGIPNTDPAWLPVLDNFLTTLQGARLSGTYWNYAFHSPSDPSWWPVNDPLSIINDGRSNPQMVILSKHNTASP